MGANPTQALALFLFLAAFVIAGAAFYAGGNLILLLAGLVSLGASIAIFLKAKPLEHAEG